MQTFYLIKTFTVNFKEQREGSNFQAWWMITVDVIAIGTFYYTYLRIPYHGAVHHNCCGGGGGMFMKCKRSETIQPDYRVSRNKNHPFVAKFWIFVLWN